MTIPLPPFYVQPIAIVRPAVAVQKTVEHIVKPGDSLTTIAEQHSTSVERLWAANTQLDNPDLIMDGELLKIPQDSDKLDDRPMPVTIENTTGGSTFSIAPAISPPSGGFSNTYYYRQCVWYAKEKRPDIPNTWGNATDWLTNAQAQGWPTGSTARAGSIGWTYGHVVYIESVNDDGTVYLSEMNYDYNGGFRYRTAPATDFTYIY